MSYRTRTIDQEWHRLIPSRFPPVEVYERLGRPEGDPELWAVAKELENKTNPRLQAKAWLLGKSGEFSESSPRLQNWNQAPFSYRNPEGSTFLPAAYGVFEAVSGVRPALARAVRRREIFLSRTSEPSTGLDMRMLITRVKGELVDLTDEPWEGDEDRRREIGRRIYDEGAHGIVFRSPDEPRCLAVSVFENGLLGRTVQGAHYRFVWDSAVIRKVYDFSDGMELSRAEIFQASQSRVAA